MVFSFGNMYNSKQEGDIMEDYRSKIEAIEQELKVGQNRSFQYAVMRCILMLCILSLIYYAVYYNSVLYVFAFIVLCMFLYVVRIHNVLKKKLEFKRESIFVLQKLIARKTDDWKKEDVQYLEYKNMGSVESDLDIFGTSSLFQYMNMAHTPLGKKRLMQLLSVQCPHVEEVKERQLAVLELLHNRDFLLIFQVQSSLFAKHSKKLPHNIFEHILNRKPNKNHQWIELFLSMIRILTLLTGILTLCHWLPSGYFYLLCLVNISLSLLCYSYHQKALSNVKNIQVILSDYEEMICHIWNTQFETTSLCTIQKKLQDASKAMQSLSRIATLVQFRNNILTYSIANALYTLDFKCNILLNRWIDQYGNEMNNWLLAVAEMESLSSLCVIAQVKQVWCMPEVKNPEECMLQVQGGYHPLIQEEKAISNSIQATASSNILTGSNMSGKTTFLRMLGSNMVLLKAGAPVCAKQMSSSILALYTSMRVHDEVQKGISTFYAELLRIKEMVEYCNKKIPMIVFVDEIFKGTNSIDRIYCAKEVIRKLHCPWVISFFSTHDFELCDLDKDPFVHAINYHFEEYYENDQICFDYLLKEGKCITTNARALMKLAGLLES